MIQETHNTVSKEMIANRFYEGIPLTKEEEKEGLLERKKKKYFHDKHAPYWEEKEKNINDENHVFHRGIW
jgi:hypothetical protein